MKGSVLFERILVLLVTQQRESVLLFPGDAGFRRHVFGGLDHGALSVGVAVEVVPHPLLALAPAAGSERVRVIHMRPVACFITGDRQDTASGISLDLEGSTCQHTRGGC